MQPPANTIPLTRRLVGQFLVFGLACLLFCVGTSLALSYRQQLDANVWLILVATCLFLVVGAFAVFYTSRRSSMIERQLLAVQAVPSITMAGLSRISGNDALVAGWNKLVEKVAEQETWHVIENRLAEAAGEAQHSQAEQVLHDLPIGIAIADADEAIRTANPAFAGSAGGKEAEELEGITISEALKFEMAANSDEFLDRLEGYQGTLTFDLQRGNHIESGVLRVTRCPCDSCNQEESLFMWIVRDVTQQMLAEEMRSQFVSTATHELRTPLSNIRSYAEMLDIEGGVSVEKQKEFCNIINSEATRLLRFVDELLSINQMEVGSLSIHRHSTDLETLVQSVLNNVRPECEKKQITLEAKLPAKWPKLNVDKDKIESALVNLVGNAAKYTPAEGLVVVEVEVNDSDVQIHVEDNGIGISEEELPNVFDKFYRSADERVLEIAGNGLGLSFTSEVARMHGGKLTVNSELNKGSRFTFELPRN